MKQYIYDVMKLFCSISLCLGVSDVSFGADVGRTIQKKAREVFYAKQIKTEAEQKQRQIEEQKDSQEKFKSYIAKLEKHFNEYKELLDKAPQSVDSDGKIEIKTDTQRVEKIEKDIKQAIKFANTFLVKSSQARRKSLALLEELSPVHIFYDLTKKADCYQSFTNFFAMLKLAGEEFETPEGDMASSVLMLADPLTVLKQCLNGIRANPSTVGFTHSGKLRDDIKIYDQIVGISTWANTDDKIRALQFLEAYYYEALRVNHTPEIQSGLASNLKSVQQALRGLNKITLPEPSETQKKEFDFAYIIDGFGTISNHVITELALDDDFRNYYKTNFLSVEDSLKTIEKKAGEFDVDEKIKMLKSSYCDIEKYTFAAGYLVSRKDSFTPTQRNELVHLNLKQQLNCFNNAKGKPKFIQNKRNGFLINMVALDNSTALTLADASKLKKGKEKKSPPLPETEPTVSAGPKVTSDLAVQQEASGVPSSVTTTTTTTSTVPITTTTTGIVVRSDMEKRILSQLLLGLEKIDQQLTRIDQQPQSSVAVQQNDLITQNVLARDSSSLSQKDANDIRTLLYAYHKYKEFLVAGKHDFNPQISAQSYLGHQIRKVYWLNKLPEANRKKVLYGDYITVANDSKNDTEFVKKVIERGLPITLEAVSPETESDLIIPSKDADEPTHASQVLGQLLTQNLPMQENVSEGSTNAPTTTSTVTTPATTTSTAATTASTAVSTVTKGSSAASSATTQPIVTAPTAASSPVSTGWRLWTPVRWVTNAWHGIQVTISSIVSSIRGFFGF